MINQKFGKWTVLKLVEKTDKYMRHTKYECRCDCGVIKTVRKTHLINNISTQCASCANKKHGLYKHPLYEAWCKMKQRCYNKNHNSYKYYGERGIKVCERWNSFENFLLDMGERPSAIHSLDRIDPNGNYEPTNCRWSTPKEQCENRRQ